MKLILTIQELKDPETLVIFKAVSASLDVTLPDAKGKDKGRRINVMTTTKEIPGMDRIVEGMVTSMLKLDKQNRNDGQTVTGPITIPNRATTRRKK